MEALEPLAGKELERQLARYGRVRLDPTPAQARRARTAVMEAAWRQRLASADHEPARAARRGLFAGWSARRAGASMAAAVIAGLLVGSTAFAASRAGGPLYDARITIEAATLPSEPGARLDAELAQAQTRLAEAVEAAGRDDRGAVEAALGAYERSLDDLAATTGGPAARALEAVQFHRSVLEDLLGTVPPQALAGLENALEHSSGVIDRLGAAGTPGTNPNAGGGSSNGGGENPNAGGGSSNGGGTNPNAGGGGSSNGGGENPNAGGGNPNAGGGPERTPSPQRTPKPKP